jgi:hypothetical protein
MKNVLLFLSFLFLSACAHHRDVRPGADGVHRVVFLTEEKGAGGSEAMSQASHYCKEFQKHAVVVDEKSTYTGSMKEETYQNTKVASKVATGVGSAAYVFGGKNESNAGGL